MLGRLDISGNDYLTSWIAVAFKVESAQECSNSSGLVPRLGCWLASELIKGLKGVRELQFKIHGFAEGCTPQGIDCTSWQGSDSNDFRRPLITSQLGFLVGLKRHPVSDLQNFSSNVMRVLTKSQLNSEQWPNQRMLGEFLFHKLRKEGPNSVSKNHINFRYQKRTQN